MKLREKLTAKINLKDAIFGGASMYVSVLLVSYLFIFGTGFALRLFGIVNETGEFIVSNGMFPDNLLAIFVAVTLAIFLIVFFLLVLFEESYFSKHEKGILDLLGLGLVWGTVFVTLDAMVESFVLYVSMYRGEGAYYMLSLRSSFIGPFYWFAVLYIIFLPVSLYYLRKNHKEHYEKKRLEKEKV